MHMKQDNRGYSIVELIVVIAIMAVTVAAVGLSVNTLFNSRAKECAEKVSAKLSSTRSGAMSRYNETMTLSYKAKNSSADITSDGYYTVNEMYSVDKTGAQYKMSGSEVERMGGKNVKIVVKFSNSSEVELGTGNSVTISYDRASGKQSKASLNGTVLDAYVTEMKFTSGTGTKTITLIPETGKHSLD